MTTIQTFTNFLSHKDSKNYEKTNELIAMATLPFVKNYTKKSIINYITEQLKSVGKANSDKLVGLAVYIESKYLTKLMAVTDFSYGIKDDNITFTGNGFDFVSNVIKGVIDMNVFGTGEYQNFKSQSYENRQNLIINLAKFNIPSDLRANIKTNKAIITENTSRSYDNVKEKNKIPFKTFAEILAFSIIPHILVFNEKEISSLILKTANLKFIHTNEGDYDHERFSESDILTHASNKIKEYKNYTPDMILEKKKAAFLKIMNTIKNSFDGLIPYGDRFGINNITNDKYLFFKNIAESTASLTQNSSLKEHLLKTLKYYNLITFKKVHQLNVDEIEKIVDNVIFKPNKELSLKLKR